MEITTWILAWPRLQTASSRSKVVAAGNSGCSLRKAWRFRRVGTGCRLDAAELGSKSRAMIFKCSFCGSYTQILDSDTCLLEHGGRLKPLGHRWSWPWESRMSHHVTSCHIMSPIISYFDPMVWVCPGHISQKGRSPWPSPRARRDWKASWSSPNHLPPPCWPTRWPSTTVASLPPVRWWHVVVESAEDFFSWNVDGIWWTMWLCNMFLGFSWLVGDFVWCWMVRKMDDFSLGQLNLSLAGMGQGLVPQTMKFWNSLGIVTSPLLANWHRKIKSHAGSTLLSSPMWIYSKHFKTYSRSTESEIHSLVESKRVSQFLGYTPELQRGSASFASAAKICIKRMVPSKTSARPRVVGEW